MLPRAEDDPGKPQIAGPNPTLVLTTLDQEGIEPGECSNPGSGAVFTEAMIGEQVWRVKVDPVADQSGKSCCIRSPHSLDSETGSGGDPIATERDILQELVDVEVGVSFL